MTPSEVPNGELILYQTEDGRTRIECRFDGDTIWLTQVHLAELFETSVPNINIHLKAIYEEGELDEAATTKPYLMVRSEGRRSVSRQLLQFSLPAVLAVRDFEAVIAETKQLEAGAKSGRGRRRSRKGERS